MENDLNIKVSFEDAKHKGWVVGIGTTKSYYPQYKRH